MIYTNNVTGANNRGGWVQFSIYKIEAKANTGNI